MRGRQKGKPQLPPGRTQTKGTLQANGSDDGKRLSAAVRLECDDGTRLERAAAHRISPAQAMMSATQTRCFSVSLSLAHLSRVSMV
ncbi:hypothetical protein KFK09_002306 [Dendrobium nobile]|uniref:Uncharacterized protein n=1 Tax=Dendrobium nobile TaxID=94219 RepID=A0A8T3C9U3_DENNO|nr:hypothetical protein KFK09_002306 [Dendrobium nobile]